MTSPRRPDRLGIGMLSVFGLPPIELVNLTADLGCRYMSVAMQGMPLVPLDYPPYSLAEGARRANAGACSGLTPTPTR